MKTSVWAAFGPEVLSSVHCRKCVLEKVHVMQDLAPEKSPPLQELDTGDALSTAGVY